VVELLARRWIRGDGVETRRDQHWYCLAWLSDDSGGRLCSPLSFLPLNFTMTRRVRPFSRLSVYSQRLLSSPPSQSERRREEVNVQLAKDPLVEAVLSIFASRASDPELHTQPRISDDHVVDDVVAISDPSHFETSQALERVLLALRLRLEPRCEEGGPGLRRAGRHFRRGRESVGSGGFARGVDSGEGEKGSERLGRVVEVGQGVDDRDLGVGGQGLDFGMRADSGHDSVDHRAKDTAEKKTIGK
jgi:hypothetical protein